jgi:hypothetical protein
VLVPELSSEREETISKFLETGALHADVFAVIHLPELILEQHAIQSSLWNTGNLIRYSSAVKSADIVKA